MQTLIFETEAEKAPDTMPGRRRQLKTPSPQPSNQGEKEKLRSFSGRGEGHDEGGLLRQLPPPVPTLEDWIKERAHREGFDTAGIASPDAMPGAGSNLRSFIEAGFHGEMAWLEAKAGRRADPSVLWPKVRSIVMLGMTYAPESDPLAALAERSRAAISVYAKGQDYHDVIKKKLKAVARDFAARAGAEVKVFVDTAPVMEKPLAQTAGLGWQGKHTNLVSRDFGSWLFLGAIFTSALLQPDQSEGDRCGSCRRCLDICPTQAFPAPYRLDARRCISYLTIEHKTQIPYEFRAAMGNRVYGCDDCLAVCPWNKFAQQSHEARFFAMESADNPTLASLLALDDAAFRARFSRSPIKRIGRDRFIRNVLVAAGNSGSNSVLAGVLPLLSDASPLVRGLAVWAMRRLASPDEAAISRAMHYPKECDGGVLMEWDRAS